MPSPRSDRIEALLTMADRAGTGHEQATAQRELDRVLARERLVLAPLQDELARWLAGIVVTIYRRELDMLIIHTSEREPRTYLLGSAPLVREALRAYQHLGEQMQRAWDAERAAITEHHRRMAELHARLQFVPFEKDPITQEDRDAFLYGVGERLYQLVLEYRERTEPPEAASPADPAPPAAAAAAAPPTSPVVPPAPTSAPPQPAPGYEGTLRQAPPVQPVTAEDCRRIERDLKRQIDAINAGRRRADRIPLGGPLLMPRPLPALVLPAAGDSEANGDLSLTETQKDRLMDCLLEAELEEQEADALEPLDPEEEDRLVALAMEALHKP